MRSFVPSLRTRLLVRAAAIALVSGSVAACSSDSSRFGESPFSNPFSSASNDAPAPAPRHRRDDAYYTGSVQAAPTTRVQRAPLGAPSPAQQRPMYGYGGGESSSNGAYRSSRVEPVRPQPTYRSEPASTGSVSGRSSSGWSSDGGSTIVVGRGETLTVISNRYGVPASAILRANGLSNANGVVEGSRLVIPSYSGASAPRVAVAPAPAPVRPAQVAVRPAPLAVQPTTVAVRPAPARAQVVATAPAPGAPRMQFVQGAQPRGVEAKPALKPVAALPAKPAPALKPSVGPAPTPVVAAAPAKPVPVKVAVAKPADADNVKTAALKVDPAPAPSVADSGPSFRWPVRGRVISGYGSKTSGASNDGVNIAVPVGTDVKASDDGVVAYSGSELKGFGNLVLIRHPNGWVTAYAHNSALNVKRGDAVRRGQIIAKSGATGSVSSPQLHFEVRKGAQTVDPIKHLPDV